MGEGPRYSSECVVCSGCVLVSSYYYKYMTKYMILVLETKLFFSFIIGGLAFGQDVIYLFHWLEWNFGFL